MSACMNTTLNLEQLLFLPCLWLVCSRYSSENAAFFSPSGNEVNTYPSGCFSLPWCHTSIRKASSRLCWSPQRLQARVQLKASGMAAFFTEIFFSPVNQMPVKLTKPRLGGAKFRSRMHRLGKDFLSFLHLCHLDLWGEEKTSCYRLKKKGRHQNAGR